MEQDRWHSIRRAIIVVCLSTAACTSGGVSGPAAPSPQPIPTPAPPADPSPRPTPGASPIALTGINIAITVGPFQAGMEGAFAVKADADRRGTLTLNPGDGTDALLVLELNPGTTQARVRHVYDAPGQYTATATVTSTAGPDASSSASSSFPVPVAATTTR